MGKTGTKRTKSFLRAKGPHNPKPPKEQVNSSTYTEPKPFSLATKKGEVFKPHMMYKDCKEVMAKTMKKHLSLKKKGYDHKKSKNCKK